jgi:hypothetical protein
LRLIRGVGEEAPFEFWGYSLLTSQLNERTHKLEAKMLPHLWGRLVSCSFGWVYRGQIDMGSMHGLGGVVWCRVELRNGVLCEVCESYIGQWKQGRREGRGVFIRYNGISEQGVWLNNNLVEESYIGAQELVSFQAAINRGEAAATKAESRAKLSATKALCKSSNKSDSIMSGQPTESETEADCSDPFSSDYILKLMELVIANSQDREAAHVRKLAEHDMACKEAEEIKRQQAAALALRVASSAAVDSDSDDESPLFCALGTAFFAGRVYFGDRLAFGHLKTWSSRAHSIFLIQFLCSPVNVGIEFGRNSRPIAVKEVLEHTKNHVSIVFLS